MGDAHLVDCAKEIVRIVGWEVSKMAEHGRAAAQEGCWT